MAQEALWRLGALEDERHAIAAIDGELLRLAEAAAALSRERQKIANRACQRARYWLKQDETR